MAARFLLKAADRRLGLTSALAACLREERQPGKILHEMEELLTQPGDGMAFGYEDAQRRRTSGMRSGAQVVGGRDPIDGEDLASQAHVVAFGKMPRKSPGTVAHERGAGGTCVIARHRKRLHGRARRIHHRSGPDRRPTHGQQTVPPFSIATTIAYCYLPMVGFLTFTTRRNSIWLPPCCARVMFPGSACDRRILRRLLRRLDSAFPGARSFAACAWMGGVCAGAGGSGVF